MKSLFRFFLSLRTAFLLFTAFVAVLFIGSLSLPDNLSFFSGIDDTPLFTWLRRAGNIPTTWWIYLLILLLAVLAASLAFCTVDALLKRVSRRQFALTVSPQIMHIGVLFIMLGHLLTASLGFKTDVVVKQGERTTVAGTAAIMLQDVTVWKDRNGYDTDWEAKVVWTDSGTAPFTAFVRPAHPAYAGTFGLYSKSVSLEPQRSALIRVCRDPGAVWALLGGVLLSAGGIGFLYGRSKAAD